MYICIYVYMYISLYIYIYMYICTNIYIYIYVNMYLCMYVCIYIYVYICINVCIYEKMYICIYVFIKIRKNSQKRNISNNRNEDRQHCARANQQKHTMQFLRTVTRTLAQHHVCAQDPRTLTSPTPHPPPPPLQQKNVHQRSITYVRKIQGR